MAKPVKKSAKPIHKAKKLGKVKPLMANKALFKVSALSRSGGVF